MVDDLWALVLADLEPAAALLTLVRDLASETDLSVWRRIIGSLSVLDRVASAEAAPPLRDYIVSLLAPALDRLGPNPVPGEAERVTNLRAALFEALGTLGRDTAVLTRSKAIVDGDEQVDGSARRCGSCGRHLR